MWHNMDTFFPASDVICQHDIKTELTLTFQDSILLQIWQASLLTLRF